MNFNHSQAGSQKKILAIRLQALGDVVITLPYLQSLKEQFPKYKIDFLTRKETSDIPKNVKIFNHVYAIGGGRIFKLQFILTIFLLRKLVWQKYDVVIDLQNNLLSRMVRKVLRPKIWSAFDRYSSISAGERTRQTINAAEIGEIKYYSKIDLKNNAGLNILKSNGWDQSKKLIVLNPAGFYASRNWPVENYIKFAKLCLSEFDGQVQFIILGLDRVSEKANILKNSLQNHIINLVNKTSVIEAFVIIRRTNLVISEDSALMHMAWVNNVPTIALFGASRSDWSAPLGELSICLNSSDLECGECMQPNCIYGDVHCLTRFTPQYVFEHAVKLLEKSKKEIV